MSRYVYVIPPFSVKIWVNEALMNSAINGDWESRVNLAGSIRLRLKLPEKRLSLEALAKKVNWQGVHIEGAPSEDCSNVIPFPVQFGTCPSCGCKANGIGIGVACPNCGKVTNYGR